MYHENAAACWKCEKRYIQGPYGTCVYCGAGRNQPQPVTPELLAQIKSHNRSAAAIERSQRNKSAAQEVETMSRAKPAAERRTKNAGLMLTPGDYERIAAEANRRYMEPSMFIRQVVLTHLDRLESKRQCANGN